MIFNKRDLETLHRALFGAIEWEQSIVEAHRVNPKDPEYRAAKHKAKKYARLRLKIGRELSLRMADKSTDEDES